MNSMIAKKYFKRIEQGFMTLDMVPIKYREEVEGLIALRKSEIEYNSHQTEKAESGIDI